MYQRKQPTMLRATNPTRPPDWRWQRVCELVNSGGYAVRRSDGELISRVVRHVRNLNKLCAEWAVQRLAKRDPDIFFALKLANEDSYRPLEVKARTLARQSTRTIAREMGVPGGIVQVYLDLQFDVQDRLGAQTWVSQVAGLNPSQPPSPEALFLASAYFRGPSVIEAWLDYLQDPSGPCDLRTEDGRRRESIQLLIDTHGLEVDDTTRLTLCKLLSVIASIQPKLTNMPTVGAAVSRNLSYLTPQIRWKPEVSKAGSDHSHRRKRRYEGGKHHTEKAAQAG